MSNYLIKSKIIYKLQNYKSCNDLQLYKKDNKKFGKYKAYTKIVMTNNKLVSKKIVYSPETFETIIKNAVRN